MAKKYKTTRVHKNTAIEQLMWILCVGKEQINEEMQGYWVTSPMYVSIALYNAPHKEYVPLHCNIRCYLKQRGYNFDEIIKECLHTVMQAEDGEVTHVVRHKEVHNNVVEIVEIPAFALYEVLHRMHFKPKKKCKTTNG